MPARVRRADGELIGVRYWLAEQTQPLLETARSLTYTVVDDAGCIEIYFGPAEMAASNQSHDQEFLYDAVFRASDGEWAIAFDMAALARADVDRLHQADVKWTWATGLHV